MSADLDQFLAHAQSASRTPLLQACLARDGVPEWEAVIGEGQPGPARIGSITKTFTAALALDCLGEAGLGRLVSDYLPEAAGRPWGSARVEQLLSHTAGWRAEPSPPWWERAAGRDFTAMLPDLDDVARLPLGQYHYSNLGYGVVGAILERTAGAPYQELLEELARGWGLCHTSYLRPADAVAGFSIEEWSDQAHPEPAPDTAAMAAAGQAWSTVHDLVRFGALLRSGDAPRLAGVETLRRPVATVTGRRQEQAYGWGLRLIREGDRWLFGHTGTMPGYQAVLLVDPTGYEVAVLANATRGLDTLDLALNLIVIASGQGGGARPRVSPGAPPAWTPSPTRWPELLGPWYWGETCLLARESAGRLEFRQACDASVWGRFEPVSTTTWRGIEGYLTGEILEVCADSNHGLTGLEVASFQLTRNPTPGRPLSQSDSAPGQFGLHPA